MLLLAHAAVEFDTGITSLAALNESLGGMVFESGLLVELEAEREEILARLSGWSGRTWTVADAREYVTENMGELEEVLNQERTRGERAQEEGRDVGGTPST